MRWAGSAKRWRHITGRFLDTRLLWHIFHLFVLASVVFFLVLSWMGWLQQELASPVRIEASAGVNGEQRTTGRSGQDRTLSLGEYRQRIAGDIFGAETKGSQEEESEVSLQDIPLSEKNLDFELVGTIILEKTAENIAVIEDTKTGNQKMYKAGDRIDQIRIESVLRDNVVIKSSEGKKVLTMQYKSLRKSRGGRGGGDRTKADVQPADATQSISKDYVMKSLQDMSKLMQSALIKPYLQNGETVGFQLDNIQSGSFYDKIGLKNEDVIMRVDGNDLKNPQQLMGFSQQLRRKDQVSLTVRRDGKKKQIRYSLQ